MRILRLLAAALLLALPSAAFGQGAVLQGGPWSPGRAPMYVGAGSSQAIMQDSGSAGGGPVGVGLAEQLLVARGTGTPPYADQGSGPLGTNWCNYDAPIDNATGYHYLCLSPNAQGGALLLYGAAGGAAPLPLSFNVNGVNYPFPFGGNGGILGPGSSTAAHAACWNNTSGTLLSDCGVPTSGPSSATDGNAVLFSGVTGKLLKDSGVPLKVPTGSTNSIVLGLNAGVASVSTQQILAIGESALQACTICNSTVSVGFQSGQSLIDGRSSVFIGHVAGQWVTSGGSNTFIGGFAGRGGPSTGALSPALTGGDNTCVGEAACILIHGVANFNTGMGFNSLFWLGQGVGNSAYGLGSCSNVIDGVQNTCIGQNSYQFGQGGKNVIIGALAGNGQNVFGTTTGLSLSGQNTINVVDTAPFTVGHGVFSCCTPPGATITSISAGAPGTITVSAPLYANMGAPITVYDIISPHTGLGATVIGYNAAANLQGTVIPTAIGINALMNLTTGTGNTAIGSSSAAAITTQTNTTFLGASAGGSVTASNLVGVGTTALRGSLVTPLTGSNHVAIGSNALLTLQGAAANDVAIGAAAGQSMTTASTTVLIGSQAALNKTTGNNEVLIGASVGAAITTGSGNTIIGAAGAATCTTCTDNIIIGRSIDVAAAASSQTLNIGNALYGEGMSTVGAHKIGIDTAGAALRWTLDVSGSLGATLGNPASAAATCTAGQIQWNTGFIYICIAANTWQRVATATW